MAFIPMYLLSSDVELLNAWLNKEEELAFLISNGEKKWIARKEHTILPDLGTQKFGPEYKHMLYTKEGIVDEIKDHYWYVPEKAHYCLWHIPSGPLPLLPQGQVNLTKEKLPDIDNPWVGWTELTTAPTCQIPILTSHPGIIELFILLPEGDKPIPLSFFGWIGNANRKIGREAHPSTLRCWNRLWRMVRKVAIRTTVYVNNDPNKKWDIYTFPEALNAIRNGRLYEVPEDDS